MMQRRPFWLSAVNYYILAIAISAALFFLLWGTLHDGGDEVPWITAGLASCVVMAGAVFLREFIFRVSYNRQIASQRRLDLNLNGLGLKHTRSDKKLTLQKNAALLHEIKRKSDAAKVLSRLPEGHREVFEMCGRYLLVNSRELATVSPGSPRLAALLKGKDLAENYHRFHLLRWAEIEARSFSADAKQQVKLSDKIESAQKALSVINSALHFYPDEQDLKQSSEALIEFIASIKMENWMERADKAAFKGNYRQARRLYKDALYFLEHEGKKIHGSADIASRITEELRKIDQNDGRQLDSHY